MDYKRLALFSALILISLNLYQAWMKDYPAVEQRITNVKVDNSSSQTNSIEQSNTSGSYVPNIQTNEISATKESNSSASNSNSNLALNKKSSSHDLITVTTDTLNIKIDSENGNIVGANLLKYAQSSKEKDQSFKLLTDDLRKYVANSSLFIKTDKGVQNLDIKYSNKQTSYRLEAGQDDLNILLKGQTAAGLNVEKTITLKRASYLINVSYQITNNSGAPWTGQMNTQLLQQNPKIDKSSMFHVGTYTGAAVSDPDEKLYQKVSFDNIADKNFNKKIKSGWIAMQEHYFLSAWIPTAGSTNHFYSRFVDEQYIIGMVSQPFKVAPGSSLTIASKLYTGPEITSNLEQIAPGLNLTIDYGILSVISTLIFTVMSYIYSVVGNWGWSIVLVTMFIKLLFFQLSAKSYKSMASMRRLQPKIMDLRERYSDDKPKLSQATMELYRSEKVNPLGGCLPIVIQIPVFIALYWVLLESVELRQAPWIFWIHDLSEPDPFYILPVIMGLTMFIQQKLGPASPDPTQAKMMMMLPVLFTFLFSSFPAGLVLYWTVNNSLSIMQQWYITRKYSGEAPKKKTNGMSDKKLVTSK